MIVSSSCSVVSWLVCRIGEVVFPLLVSVCSVSYVVTLLCHGYDVGWSFCEGRVVGVVVTFNGVKV